MERSRELDRRVVVEVLRAADRCRRHFGRVLAPAGLTLQQYNVLRILRGAGPDGLPTLEIGERMIERTPGVTRLVDRLEALGLVERRRGDRDRRCVYCLLTGAGRERLAGLDAAIDRADADCVGALSAADKQVLSRLAARTGPAADD